MGRPDTPCAPVFRKPEGSGSGITLGMTSSTSSTRSVHREYHPSCETRTAWSLITGVQETLDIGCASLVPQHADRLQFLQFTNEIRLCQEHGSHDPRKSYVSLCRLQRYTSWSLAPVGACSIGHAGQDVCGCPRGINMQGMLSRYRPLIVHTGAVWKKLCLFWSEVWEHG